MNPIDYRIHGSEMQYVEIALDPGQAAVGEAGSLFFVEQGVALEAVLGDGSQQQGGLFGTLLGAGKRLLSGASLFTTVYTNQDAVVRRVAFAAPYPGKIVPVNLRELGGTLICQKEAFLCAERGVAIGMAFQKRLGAGFFGGEGFIMQKLEGQGLVFMHGCGTALTRTLAAGETLRVDAGCLMAFAPSVDFDIQYVGGIKTALFGGEGLFFATLSGPGTVWLQSLPFSRLASRIFAAAPAAGSRQGGGAGLVQGLLGGTALGAAASSSAFGNEDGGGWFDNDS
jgi:uncharacterized protein (TIGR00266 family)